jgi:Fe-Mn family superoxide dismutase
MARYKLPDLKYDYGALEPHYSGKIVELHHSKHHAAYVKGANTTLEQLEEARAKNDFSRIAALEKALGFHVSGHIMHSIFWQNLSPKGGGQPTGALADAITRDFGSFDAFKGQMTQCSATIMGSGWGALVFDPMTKSLMTAQLHDHQSETTMGGAPLLVFDAWEHAWYLQYLNEKGKFFDALWNLVNWDDVAKRYDSVSKGYTLNLDGVTA